MLTKVLQGSLEGSSQVHLAVSLRASQAAYPQCRATLQGAAGCDAANDVDDTAQVGTRCNSMHVRAAHLKKHAGHGCAWSSLSKQGGACHPADNS